MNQPPEANQDVIIDLSTTLRRLTRRTHDQVVKLSEGLRTKNTRRKTISRWAKNSRKSYLKIFAIMRWLQNQKLDSNERLKNLLNGSLYNDSLNSSIQFENFFHELQGHINSVSHLILPRCEIETAVEVLTTGNYQRLPQSMVPILKSTPYKQTKIRVMELFHQLHEKDSSSSSSSSSGLQGTGSELLDEITITELCEALSDEQVLQQLNAEDLARAQEIKLYFEHMEVLTKTRLLESNIPAAFSQITFDRGLARLLVPNEFEVFVRLIPYQKHVSDEVFYAWGFVRCNVLISSKFGAIPKTLSVQEYSCPTNTPDLFEKVYLGIHYKCITFALSNLEHQINLLDTKFYSKKNLLPTGFLLRFWVDFPQNFMQFVYHGASEQAFAIEFNVKNFHLLIHHFPDAHTSHLNGSLDMANLDLEALIRLSKQTQSRNILRALYNMLVRDIGAAWSNNFSITNFGYPQLQIRTPTDQFIYITVNQSTGQLEMKPSVMRTEGRSIYTNVIIRQIQNNPRLTSEIFSQIFKSDINSLVMDLLLESNFERMTWKIVDRRHVLFLIIDDQHILLNIHEDHIALSYDSQSSDSLVPPTIPLTLPPDSGLKTLREVIKTQLAESILWFRLAKEKRQRPFFERLKQEAEATAKGMGMRIENAEVTDTSLHLHTVFTNEGNLRIKFGVEWALDSQFHITFNDCMPLLQKARFEDEPRANEGNISSYNSETNDWSIKTSISRFSMRSLVSEAKTLSRYTEMVRNLGKIPNILVTLFKARGVYFKFKQQDYYLDKQSYKISLIEKGVSVMITNPKDILTTLNFIGVCDILAQTINDKSSKIGNDFYHRIYDAGFRVIFRSTFLAEFEFLHGILFVSTPNPLAPSLEGLVLKKLDFLPQLAKKHGSSEFTTPHVTQANLQPFFKEFVAMCGANHLHSSLYDVALSEFQAKRFRGDEAFQVNFQVRHLGINVYIGYSFPTSLTLNIESLPEFKDSPIIEPLGATFLERIFVEKVAVLPYRRQASISFINLFTLPPQVLHEFSKLDHIKSLQLSNYCELVLDPVTANGVCSVGFEHLREITTVRFNVMFVGSEMTHFALAYNYETNTLYKDTTPHSLTTNYTVPQTAFSLASLVVVGTDSLSTLLASLCSSFEVLLGPNDSCK